MELIVVVVISAGIAENSLNGVSRSLMIIDEDQMEQIYEYVNLGHVITPNLNDNLDIARIRANMPSRKCFKCTPNIKALLFKSQLANYAQYHLAKLSATIMLFVNFSTSTDTVVLV